MSRKSQESAGLGEGESRCLKDVALNVLDNKGAIADKTLHLQRGQVGKREAEDLIAIWFHYEEML